ncbi:MAG: glycosyltransferase, partial [Candidatus Kryptoniota bacterium]
MIKILHLIETSGPGGAETVLLNLVTGIDRNKYQSIVGLLRKGWLYDQLFSKGADVRILPSGGSFDVRLLRSLVNLIKEERIDLVHSHLMDMSLYSSIAAKIGGIPHISTEHGDIHHFLKNGRLTTIKAYAIGHLSNKIVSVSRFTKEALIRKSRVNEEKVVVIYNGIPIVKHCAEGDRAKKKSELGIGENDILVGSTGNLYPIKGHVYLLRAAKEIL